MFLWYFVPCSDVKNEAYSAGLGQYKTITGYVRKIDSHKRCIVLSVDDTDELYGQRDSYNCIRQNNNVIQNDKNSVAENDAQTNNHRVASHTGDHFVGIHVDDITDIQVAVFDAIEATEPGIA